jgi:hypothetical protein
MVAQDVWRLVVAEIDMKRLYFVPTLGNAQGEFRGLAGRKHDQLSKVIPMFTTLEKLETYLADIDQNQAFMDILERAPVEALSSEDINLGTYVEATVEDLLPALQDLDADTLLVDPLDPGVYQRAYPSPHNS